MGATPRGPMRFETAAIHAGQDPDAPYGAVNVPIYQTSTYAQPSVGKPKVFDYARGGNPTREAFQQALAALEGGERCFAFGSGMARRVDPAADPSARRPRRCLPTTSTAARTGCCRRCSSPGVCRSRRVDLNDLDAVRGALRPETRIVWFETPSNPLLKIVDIEAVADGRARGRRSGRRRQHVRHAGAAAAARARRRRRHAQRDEVHRRALRPDRRRGRHERPGVDRAARVPA